MASIKIKASFAGAPVSPSINVEDEGVLIVSTQDLNFVGAGVTVTENPAGTAEIDIPGNPLTVKDEGLNIISNPANMNFIGAGVTVTEDPAGTAKVNIPGSTGIAIGDPVGGAASGDMLFVNSAIQLAKNSLFKFDTANTRLGIGTNTPLGVLHLKTAAATTRMLIDGDAAQNKILTYRTNGLQRFGLYTDNTAESGSNAGSDFKIRAYNDAGALLTTPFFIKRSTGNIGINTTTAISAKLNIAGSGATSATSSFIIKNSANVDALNFKDDLTSTFGGTITGTNFRGTGNSGGSFESNSVSSSTDAFYSLLLGQIRLYTNVGGYFKANTSIIVDANGIGSLNASAVSQIDSTTKGFLPPRMSTAQKNLIVAPAAGLVVYDTTLNKLCVFTTAWETITSV